MFVWLVLIAGFVLLCSLAYAAASGAPWVPTWKRDQARLLALLELRPGDTFYELGCGLGGVCLAVAADPAVKVVGVELSLLQWFISQVRRVLGRRPNLSIVLGNLFKVDLTPATAVYFFLMPETYSKLKNKLECELRPGTRVVSYVWPIPGWTPVRNDHREGSPDLYLYVVGAP